MKKIYYLLLTLAITSFSFGQDMVITGAFDGPLAGGTPKLIEVYVINDITDLSTYGFGSANNGEGTDGQELTFAGSATAGDFIYITDGGNGGEANFMTYFGIEPDYVSSSASINGDDALELFSGGVVIDTFGDINADGTGTPWEYLDGWAYRTDSTGPEGATFTDLNWIFSGANAIDNCTSNSTCTSVFPIGSYTSGATFTPPSWAGDWVFDPVAGAIAVGPTPENLIWWSSNDADVQLRSCLFDDIYRFNTDGSYEQIMQDQTWVESWQGVAEGCGAAVAPHDGSNPATYTYTENTITVTGNGAFMGLAKVHNTGEDGLSGGSITYNVVSVDENYLVVNIQYSGTSTWQFRFRNANYTPPTTEVTFTVNTANIEVGANGMYLGGGVFGGAQAHAMTDADEDGIWEVTLTLNEGITGNYIFLNSPNAQDDWGAKEGLGGQSCANGPFDDRLLAPVGADDYTLQHCFASCETDGTCPTVCGDIVTHCYTSGTYSIFDSAVDNAGDIITVTINAGVTESDYDNLVVYDSSDSSGNILYSADGDHAGQVIESTTGLISVWIDGDGSYNCTDGFGGPYTPLEMVVSCSAPPSCIDPTNLTVSDLTATTASLSWSAGGTEMDYEYVVQAAGTGEPTAAGTAVTGSSTVSVIELNANTDYEVYVRSNCGTDGFSLWEGPLNFTTPCEAYSIPYFEGFEAGYTHASTVGGCLSQESISGMGTWLANNTLTSYNRAPRTGDWNAYVGYSNEDWLFISVDLIADTSYTASVYARQDGSTASNSNITISYGASASAAAMTNPIVPATGIVNGDYQLISGAFTPITSGIHVIGIKGYMNGLPYYISLDDISIDLSPNCLSPTDLAVSDITTTTASVSWTANSSEMAWEYQVVASGAMPAETGTATSENPLALTTLTANTTYDVYVRANCGAGETSDWVTVEFTTECDTVTAFPYTHGFENLDCWSNTNVSAAWALDDGSDYGPGSVTEGNSAVFFNDYDYTSGATSDLMSPNLDLSALTIARLSFDYFDGGGSDTVEVLVDSGSGPVVVYTTAATVSSWTTIEIDLPDYAGQTIKVGFRGTSIYGGSNPHIDNLIVAEAPACLAPTDLAVADVTTTTASVSWTANSGESAWEYQVVESGVDPDATGDTTSNNPLELILLTANTTYDVYVRANCGTDGTSEWVTVSFTTLCEVASGTWSNDFNTNNDCWLVSNGGDANTWQLFDDSVNGGGAGSFGITFGSTAHDDYLISPAYTVTDGATDRMSFDARNQSTSFLESIDVQIWNADITVLLETVATGVTPSTVYETFSYDLSAYEGQDIRFAFYISTTDQFRIFVDNVVVDGVLGLEDVNTSSNFTYFPNPVNNVLSIKAQASIDSITVYNMLGQTVVRSTPNTTTTAVDMSGLQTGAYFVQVAINNSIETVRVIKN